MEHPTTHHATTSTRRNRSNHIYGDNVNANIEATRFLFAAPAAAAQPKNVVPPQNRQQQPPYYDLVDASTTIRYAKHAYNYIIPTAPNVGMTMRRSFMSGDYNNFTNRGAARVGMIGGNISRRSLNRSATTNDMHYPLVPPVAQIQARQHQPPPYYYNASIDAGTTMRNPPYATTNYIIPTALNVGKTIIRRPLYGYVASHPAATLMRRPPPVLVNNPMGERQQLAVQLLPTNHGMYFNYPNTTQERRVYNINMHQYDDQNEQRQYVPAGYDHSMIGDSRSTQGRSYHLNPIRSQTEHVFDDSTHHLATSSNNDSNNNDQIAPMAMIHEATTNNIHGYVEAVSLTSTQRRTNNVLLNEMEPNNISSTSSSSSSSSSGNNGILQYVGAVGGCSSSNGGNIAKSQKAAKPYKCLFEGCGYSSLTNGNLKYHSYSHVNKEIKPYKCSTCEFASHNPRCLSHHMKIHSSRDSKPYKCTFEGCEYSSRHKAVLKRHSYVHVKR